MNQSEEKIKLVDQKFNKLFYFKLIYLLFAFIFYRSIEDTLVNFYRLFYLRVAELSFKS